MKEKHLFLEIDNRYLKFIVIIFDENLNPKIIKTKEAKVKNYFNFDRENKNEELINCIKENLKLIENEVEAIFKSVFIILSTDKIEFINIMGTKKMSGAQISKEDVSHIINDLKDYVLDNEKNRKILHLFNSKYYLDKKEKDNLPIGLSGEVYNHQLTFFLIKDEIIKNLNSVLGKSNLKIERIILKDLPKCINLSREHPKEDIILKIEIKKNTSTINIFDKSSLTYFENFNFGTQIILNDVIKVCSLKLDSVVKIFSEIDFDNLNNNENKILDKKYFDTNIFKKISLSHIKDIVSARVDEIVNILLSKNINLKTYMQHEPNLVIYFEDKIFFKNFHKMFKNTIKLKNHPNIKQKTQDELSKITLISADLIFNGWSKEALPLIQEKKSLISSIFSKLFD